MREIWILHRRGLAVGGVLLVALALFAVGVAVVIHSTHQPTQGQAASAPTDSRSASVPVSTIPSSAATDVATWDAMPAVTPAVSAAYPAIGRTAGSDPSGFAQAFATELFTRNYRTSTRDQLISWVQYENAPLRSPNYPAKDWTKVLVNSLTDLSWDDATDTPIPADGPWLALRAERATQTVSNVQTGPDPQWEQTIAGGYQPPDQLATVRDVSLTVTEKVAEAGQVRTSVYDVALALQLGTSPRGGYGVAVTNNYVVKERG